MLWDHLSLAARVVLFGHVLRLRALTSVVPDLVRPGIRRAREPGRRAAAPAGCDSRGRGRAARRLGDRGCDCPQGGARPRRAPGRPPQACQGLRWLRFRGHLGVR